MDIDQTNSSNILFKPKPFVETLHDTDMIIQDKNIINQTGTILNRSSMMTYGKM